MLFLDVDVEPIHSDWLTRMMGHCMLPHIGAVGAKLLYSDRETIQHAGIINIKNGPVCAFDGVNDHEPSYFGRTMFDYDQLAVTGACLLIDRKKFDQVGGFSEDFSMAYNDVELCLKLLRSGYYNIVRNDVTLVHNVPIRCGVDEDDAWREKRLEGELEELFQRYPEYRGRDPFYNCNLPQDRCDYKDTYEFRSVASRIWIKSKWNEGGIRYAIDEVRENGDDLTIIGWAFCEENHMEDSETVFVILEGRRQKRYRCSTVRLERPDVDAFFQGNGNLQHTGFLCILDKLAVPAESYRIGIELAGRYALSDKTLDL